MKKTITTLLEPWLCIELLVLIVIMCLGFIAWLFQLETNGTFLEFLERFYISGSIGSLVAWRGHIALLIATAIYAFFEDLI